MKVLMTMLVATMFSINIFAQKSVPKIDSIGILNPLYNYDWNNPIYLDSINKYNIQQLGSSDRSSILSADGTIEPNGLRIHGTLYTMKIKVPEESNPDKMPMPYNWGIWPDSIDPGIIFPPVKKK